jgi:hypothetical protein
MFSQAKFHHRHNKYGGHDSICPGCLMTVACVEYEWELASLESAHDCDPVNLYWITQARVYALIQDQAVAACSLLESRTIQADNDRRCEEGQF